MKTKVLEMLKDLTECIAFVSNQSLNVTFQGIKYITFL
ncbi:Uncharacterised protein [Klebsiella pneumoniae]|nr:hypothetical protein A1WC_05116 [Klebsiella sp. KTE92]KDL57855.1 hypothetical protein AD95_05296 [Klebsiella pneumoniae MGH 69]CAD2017255.1 hypothetical protein AI2770V1_5020 [Klebsiella pneumoniae]CAD2017678.1 hypothetical protein AI2764V1_5024 [Klebsiella pneumoniae]CAD2018500.1 hypothetical protein AI2775V1_5020 [Klebsiella pneumoniae]